MTKSFLHNFSIIIVLFLVAVCFNFSANAAGKNTISNSSKQVSTSLMKRAKSAIQSGNTRLAQSLWIQAKSLDPSLNQPAWFSPDKAPRKEQPKSYDEKEFINKLRNMSYSMAKSELDQRLVFNPNNNKLRLVYLELAEANNDEQEAEHHRKMLGIKKEIHTNNIWSYFKYLLIIIVFALIVFEVKTIIKPTYKASNEQIAPNIRSI